MQLNAKIQFCVHASFLRAFYTWNMRDALDAIIVLLHLQRCTFFFFMIVLCENWASCFRPCIFPWISIKYYCYWCEKANICLSNSFSLAHQNRKTIFAIKILMVCKRVRMNGHSKHPNNKQYRYKCRSFYFCLLP